MKEFLEFLNHFGIHLTVNESSSPILGFCVVILVLSILALLCVLNIIIYLIVLNISENKYILDKISEYKLFFKIFILYKNTRLVYLAFEFMFLIINLFSIIYLCGRVAYGIS
uniref:Uncharacterized protein n=1 Tax=Pleurotus pulmonarius TaxID=28995 RepID=A0A2U8XDR7_PLEPU|nr:hypothetical protein [Pleurotus pulmonarius]